MDLSEGVMKHPVMVLEKGRNALVGQQGRNLYLISGLVLSVLVGTYLRFKGIFSAFWLDEIWSLKLVRELGSPLEVVTKLHIDNNHIINSLYMYMVGDTPS